VQYVRAAVQKSLMRVLQKQVVTTLCIKTIFWEELQLQMADCNRARTYTHKLCMWIYIVNLLER